jgi:hypothetical protein
MLKTTLQRAIFCGVENIRPRKFEWAWTKNQEIAIPHEPITQEIGGHIYVPLRGYGYVLAVFNVSQRCIGWIDVAILGHKTVKEWCRATAWVDNGL